MLFRSYDNTYHAKLSSYDDIGDGDKENGLNNRHNNNHDHDSLREKGKELSEEDKKKEVEVDRKNLHRPRKIRGI